MEGTIGEIRMFAGNFAPRNWALCQGQLLPISQNTALFSILGTTYGGNGQTTFALPDFRGRVPVGQGQGPGLPSVQLGEVGGEWSHTLTVNEMPAHNHVATAPGSSAATSKSPSGAAPAFTASGSSYGPAADLAMIPGTIGNTGGSQPHPNVQPYLGMNFIICLFGVYPSRN